jgi:hypothetical protein
MFLESHDDVDQEGISWKVLLGIAEVLGVQKISATISRETASGPDRLMRGDQGQMKKEED